MQPALLQLVQCHVVCRFYGRKALPWALAAGPVVWLVACQIPFFAQSGLYRIILRSLIASLYLRHRT